MLGLHSAAIGLAELELVIVIVAVLLAVEENIQIPRALKANSLNPLLHADSY